MLLLIFISSCIRKFYPKSLFLYYYYCLISRKFPHRVVVWCYVDLQGFNIAAANANQYEVWWGHTPYLNPIGGDCSTPSAPQGCALETDGTQYDHTQANPNDNYYYAVIASNSCGATASTVSNHTGTFRMTILPGD